MAKYATNTSGAIWWHICNKRKWCHLVAKSVTNASGAMPNMPKMQWCHVVGKFSPSHEVNFWVRCASGNCYAMLQNSPSDFPDYPSEDEGGGFSETQIRFEAVFEVIS